MSGNQEELIQFIKDHPELEICFLEMMEIAKAKSGTLDNGDEAEEAVIEAIQTTGHEVLRVWAKEKEKQASRHALTQQLGRPHEKKRSCGEPPLGS